MANYAALANKQNALIRKALEGSLFVAPYADALGVATAGITTLTTYTAGPPVVIDLTALPAGWDDAGWLSSDGVSFARDVTSSDVSSWGSVIPTRSDITGDTSTLSAVMQETKMLTVGLATGIDLAGVTPAANTGEVSVAKPAQPKGKYWKALALAVDLGDAGEIYVGRYFPRAKVTNYAEQNFGGGDDPISWGVTLSAEVDDAVGFSEKWYFGGPGWNALLEEMGFDVTP
jgi:hypothetical protein